MATNKRKDAAALFELIGKSTLKVPKNAGTTLQIPSWWSSKTNPPAPTVVVRGVPATPPAVSPSETRKPILDPPPAPARPMVSVPADGSAPSIRPPAKPAPAAAPAAPVPHTSHAPAPTPRRSNPNIFAPQTVDPGASGTPQARRIPQWVLMLTGLVVVALLALALYGLIHSGSQVQKPAARLSEPLTPTPSPRVGFVHTPPLVPAPAPIPAPAPAPTQVGRVYLATEVQRSPEQLYLMMFSANTQQKAQESAEFLAARGIDVSIERNANNFFCILSVQGFPNVSAADALRKRVIEISREHPSFKKTHKGPFDAPYLTRVSRPAN